MSMKDEERNVPQDTMNALEVVPEEKEESGADEFEESIEIEGEEEANGWSFSGTITRT